MKKLLVLGGVLLLIATGCGQKPIEEVKNLDFIDVGDLGTRDSVIVADVGDSQSVAWIQRQTLATDESKVREKIIVSDIAGENQMTMHDRTVIKNDETVPALRIMGFYPDVKILVFAEESLNQDFGPEIKRDATYVFLDTGNMDFIGENYMEFFKTEKGIQGIRVGKTISVYQISVGNSFAIDSAINYNKVIEVESAFTDAKLSPDQTKIAYVFSYAPETQGDNENKLLISDFSGENRKELLSTKETIKIVKFVEGEVLKVKVMVGEEEQELEI